MSGASNTVAALSLPPREAIRYLLGKTNVPTQGWSDVWQEAHARAFTVAGAASGALLSDFRAAVAKALEQGTTLAEFRADFNDIVARHGWQHTGTPGWRAQIIYETNLSMAYAAGRHAEMTQPDTLAAFPFWQYVHSGAQHPRKQHLAWNGLTLRADDPFWRTHYPPNGWKCGCRVRPLSSRDLARQGKSEPDRAPPVVTRPWRRPSDGQVIQVPEGIDPGFGYNVGEAFRGPPAGIPADARLRPPAGWVPPLPQPLPATRSFATVPEADAALMPEWRAWGAMLNAQQNAALANYKGRLGPDINAFLRDRRRPWKSEAEDPVKLVRYLDEALSQARAPTALRVFRAIGEVEARRLAHLGIGDDVTTGTYLSTTAVEAVATRGGAAVPRRAGLLIEIIVPEGTRGVAYVHPFPSYRYPQAEVLFRRRMGFRVVARTGNRLTLEVVDDRAGLQALE